MSIESMISYVHNEELWCHTSSNVDDWTDVDAILDTGEGKVPLNDISASTISADKLRITDSNTVQEESSWTRSWTVEKTFPGACDRPEEVS